MENSWLSKEFENIAGTDGKIIANFKSSDGLQTTITFDMELNPHSYDDEPAVIRSDGTNEWYEKGLLHRNKLPAVISPYDTRKVPPINLDTATSKEKENYNYDVSPNEHLESGMTIKYFTNGKLNNPKKGKPAVKYCDGSVEYYKMGLLHRRNLPAVLYSNGIEEYWVNGKLHRKNNYACLYPDGTKKSYYHGKIHSYDDNPALISPNGDKEWYNNGYLHRNGDLPAIIKNQNNRREWYKNGKRHRERGPAIIDDSLDSESYYLDDKLYENGLDIFAEDGDVYYYYNGILNSVDEDIPAVKRKDGTEKWYKNGILHRSNGPAIIDKKGNKYYYYEGKRHRLNGPAIIKASGSTEWYIHGEKIVDSKMNKRSIQSKSNSSFLLSHHKSNNLTDQNVKSPKNNNLSISISSSRPLSSLG